MMRDISDQQLLDGIDNEEYKRYMHHYNFPSYVPDMFVPYIKPQESGNRSGVRWAEITDDAGGGLRLTALGQPLHFKAVDVDEENLCKARHMEDVERLDQTVLHINGFMRGIGSQRFYCF